MTVLETVNCDRKVGQPERLGEGRKGATKIQCQFPFVRIGLNIIYVFSECLNFFLMSWETVKQLCHFESQFKAAEIVIIELN